MTAPTWHVYDAADPAQPVATLTYRSGVEGDSGAVRIEAAEGSVKEFLAYYLDDPMNQHPVFIEGEGFLPGPHSEDPEHFDLAMSALSHFFPGFQAEPAGPDE